MPNRCEEASQSSSPISSRDRAEKNCSAGSAESISLFSGIAPVSPVVVPSCGLQGYLHIECRADVTGRTFLSRQAFRAPVHLSKPYWDGNHLVINVVNLTAGLFAGDRVEMSVRVCPDARAVLTSPSAPRVFRAKDPG